MRIIVFILTLVCFFNLTANSVYIDTVYCNYYNNLVKQKQLIVNYKLKNISDEAYLKQLNGYKKYIESITNKQTEIYLYSILDETLQNITKVPN